MNQVVLPDRLDQARAGRDAVEARGVRWFAQLYKTGGGVAAYPDDAAVEDLIGARRANRSPSFEGRRCWAGVDYFTVDKTGDAWSCRTAKRHGEGRLGNLLDWSFGRWLAARPCPYTICPCTVPVHRGMVEGAA